MRITILLLIVGVCIVSAKYLPYENESSTLLRNKRSNSEESNTSVESDNDSNDNEDSDDSGEVQIDKQRRKKEEEQRKLEEKKAKELRKQDEKRQKEERKRLERIEKEKRKEEEKKRKLLEKHEKEERKKQEKQRKELEKIRKEALEEKSDEDGFLETEEENSVELGNIWRNHVYVKYGLTLASTHAEKKAILDRYLSEELGLNSNSTQSERRRAIVKLIETKLMNDTESKEVLRNQLLSQINSLTINKLQNKLNKGIEKLTNKTQILNNVTLPWANVAQQNLEEKKTFLQSISQFISNVLTNWTTETQNQNTAIQQDVQANNSNNNAIYASEGNTVANSGITEVNTDKNVVSNTVLSSGISGTENNANIAPVDVNNNAASDAALVPSISIDSANSLTTSNNNIPAIEISVGTSIDSNAAMPLGETGKENNSSIASINTNNNAASDASPIISNDTAKLPAASNAADVQISLDAGNNPAIQNNVGTSVDSNAPVPSGATGKETDSSVASINTNNNAASDASSVPIISNDTANLPAASNVADVQLSSDAGNNPAIQNNVGTSADSNEPVPSAATGKEIDSSVASINTNNNAVSDGILVPTINNDTANLPAVSNVTDVQLPSGAGNSPAVELNAGTSVDSNAALPTGIENDSDIASLNVNNNNAASDASLVPSINNDIANSPTTSNATAIQSEASNLPGGEISVGVDSNAVMPPGQSNVIITLNQSGSNSSASSGSIDTPVLESQSTGISDVLSSNSNAGSNNDNQVDVSSTISSNGDSVANNLNIEVIRPITDSLDVISSAPSSSGANVTVDSSASVQNITKNISPSEVDAGSPTNSVLVSESVVNSNDVQSNLSGVSDTNVNNEVIVPSKPNLTATDELVPIGVNVEQSDVLSGISDRPSNTKSNSNGLNNETIEPSSVKLVTSGSVSTDGNIDASNVGSSIVNVSTKDISESSDPIPSSAVNDVQESINGDNTNTVTSNSVANLPANSDPITTTSIDSSGVESSSNNASKDINSNIASAPSSIPSSASDVAEVQSSSGNSDTPAIEINIGTSDSNNELLTGDNVGSTVNVVDLITTNAPINKVSVSLDNNISESSNAILTDSLDQNVKETSQSTNANPLPPISTNESKASVTNSNIASSDVTEAPLSSGISEGTVVGIDGDGISTNKVEVSSSAPNSNINSDIGSTVNIVDIITTGAPIINNDAVLPEKTVIDINSDNISVSVNSDVGNTVNIIDIITTGAPLNNDVSVLPEQNITDVSNNNISVSSIPSEVTDGGIDGTTNQPDVSMGINVIHNVNITYSKSNSDVNEISNENVSSPSALNNVTVTTESIILSTIQQANEQNTSVSVEASTQANLNEMPVDLGVATTQAEAINNVNTASSDLIAETSLSSTGPIQIDGVTIPAEEGASVVEILPQL